MLQELRRLMSEAGRIDATGEDRGTMASSEDNDETSVTASSTRVQIPSSSLRLQHMNLILSEREVFRASSSSEADLSQSPGPAASRIIRPSLEESLLMPFQLVAETVEGNIQHIICGDLNWD